MRNGLREWCAQGAAWWIERNPMYLLSAACMAVGARMLLVSPSGRAGAIGLILLTLGVLQLYEWAVTSILLVLHRSRRSPEDERSLLLVAALFWTGPMAATAEMTARGGSLGLACAAGACVIALLELVVVGRRLGLEISLWSRAAASACVVLLAAAPPLLKVPDPADGRNEIYLYVCWWVLAGIALLTLGSVRRRLPRRSPLPISPPDLNTELAMLTIVIGATAAQLYAMNYAFFGHAQAFYGAPLMLVVAAVGVEWLARTAGRPRLTTVFGLLPAFAIVTANAGFAPEVPVRLLPRVLADPLLTALTLAGMVWWYGRLRLGSNWMMHAGSAAFAGAGWRGMLVFAPDAPAIRLLPTSPPGESRDLIVVALYAAIAYLLVVALLRRRSVEALAAVAVHQIAVCLLVWERTPADDVLIALTFCWHWLVWIHLLNWWPRTWVVLCPIALMVAVTWVYDFAEAQRWYARAHAAAMLVPLVVASASWPWMRYRAITAGVAAAHGTFYAARWIIGGDHPQEAIVVLVSFVLLGVGASVSWHKRSLLELTRRRSEPQAEPPV